MTRNLVLLCLLAACSPSSKAGAIGTDTSDLAAEFQPNTNNFMAALIGEPQTKVKLNNDLHDVTRIVLPRISELVGLDRVELEDITLYKGKKSEMKQSTGAVVDALLDAAFACHNDYALRLELRDLVVRARIQENDVNATFTSTAIEVDADLDDFGLTGTVFLNWTHDNGTYCNIGGIDYHAEVPFSIDGATLAASATVGVSNGRLTVSALDITSLALGSVDLDSSQLNFATDALLLLADLAVGTYQDIKDGFDFNPGPGICNSTGSSAKLEDCIEAILLGTLASDGPVMAGLLSTVQDTLEAVIPTQIPIASGSFSATVVPTVTAYTQFPAPNTARIDMTLDITSTQPTAACAARLTEGFMRADEGGFDPLADVDVIVPFTQVQKTIYQAGRQGLLCQSSPFTALGRSLTASVEPNGALSVRSDDGPLDYLQTAIPSRELQSAQYSQKPKYENGVIYIAFPALLKVSGVAGITSDISLTIELGFTPVLTCANTFGAQMVSATTSNIAGTVRLGPASVSATDPAITAQINAAIASYVARIGFVPFGPSVFSATPLPDAYVRLAKVERSETQIAFGLALRETMPAACQPAPEDAGVSYNYGNDVVEHKAPTLIFINETDFRNTDGPGGISTGAAEIEPL